MFKKGQRIHRTFLSPFSVIREIISTLCLRQGNYIVRKVHYDDATLCFKKCQRIRCTFLSLFLIIREIMRTYALDNVIISQKSNIMMMQLLRNSNNNNNNIWSLMAF